jgi:trans-2,3-dihydro-3-hydroxyanthranilate isomerase
MLASMRYRFFTCDVFTDRAFGGNPLAVFPDARGLSSQQMQLIAREFNLSETTFVLPAEGETGTHGLRIFTPTTELPFAGHPTIGTALVLVWTGDVAITGGVARITFEEGVGLVPVAVSELDEGLLYGQLSAPSTPEFGPSPPAAEQIAQVLSLDSSDLLGGDSPPQAVSCGAPCLFVPLRDLAAVRHCRLRSDVWEQLLQNYWAPHPYVFSYETENAASDIHSRFFAPGFGIAEDPATGAAAASLAVYLAARDRRENARLQWIVEQGIEMGRPSRLTVEADKRDGVISAIRVGGSAVIVSEGEMEIPSV